MFAITNLRFLHTRAVLVWCFIFVHHRLTFFSPLLYFDWSIVRSFAGNNFHSDLDFFGKIFYQWRKKCLKWKILCPTKINSFKWASRNIIFSKWNHIKQYQIPCKWQNSVDTFINFDLVWSNEMIRTKYHVETTTKSTIKKGMTREKMCVFREQRVLGMAH